MQTISSYSRLPGQEVLERNFGMAAHGGKEETTIAALSLSEPSMRNFSLHCWISEAVSSLSGIVIFIYHKVVLSTIKQITTSPTDQVLHSLTLTQVSESTSHPPIKSEYHSIRLTPPNRFPSNRVLPDVSPTLPNPEHPSPGDCEDSWVIS